METALRHALEHQEFALHYQPVVDLTTGQISEVEALVRWAHPQQGLVPPGQFIPLAEETGLILPIGRWVLEEACRQVQQWREQSPGAASLVVSINLSGRQLQHPDLVADIQAILQRTGIDPAPEAGDHRKRADAGGRQCHRRAAPAQSVGRPARHR